MIWTPYACVRRSVCTCATPYSPTGAALVPACTFFSLLLNVLTMVLFKVHDGGIAFEASSLWDTYP